MRVLLVVICGMLIAPAGYLGLGAHMALHSSLDDWRVAASILMAAVGSAYPFSLAIETAQRKSRPNEEERP